MADVQALVPYLVYIIFSVFGSADRLVGNNG